MGNNPGKMDSILYCGTECQKEKKIQQLEKKYTNLVQTKKDLPNKIWNAKYNYFMYKDGPNWYSNYKQNQAKTELLNLKKTIMNKLNNILVKYQDKLVVLNTQKTLLNKQYLAIDNKKRKRNILGKKLLNIKYLNSTKQREILLLDKRHIYYTVSKKIYILAIMMFILIVLISIIILIKKHSNA